MINRLGISIYPEKAGEKATFQYLENASKNGFTRVFANLLEIKNDQDGKDRLEMYKRIFNYCQKLKMIVILDVAPSIYKTFNLKPTEIDFFINLGVNGIRLDSDFGGEVEAQVSHNDRNFLVEINASISTKLIQKIISHRPNLKNIIACHNFYPMLYSGLKYE